MNKLAQNQVGGLASNPANGINNIPLAGGREDNSVTPERLLPLLHKIANSTPTQSKAYETELQEIFNQLTRDEMKKSVSTILNAMKYNSGQRTVDPREGTLDPTAPELARKLEEKVKDMQKSNEQISKEASLKGYNHREVVSKKKKKTRGNPFRVLMGKVGKLLDHGLEKRDIVRYLEKEGMFNKETIDRCVDVVRDYNRKKRRKNKNEPEEKPETKASSNNKVVLSDSSYDRDNLDPNVDWSKIDQFNFDDYLKLHKTAQTVRNQRVAAKEETIYTIKPDLTKRSTAELMARFGWLKSLSEMENAADKKGVSSELKEIRSALKARGFKDEEIQ